MDYACSLLSAANGYALYAWKLYVQPLYEQQAYVFLDLETVPACAYVLVYLATCTNCTISSELNHYTNCRHMCFLILHVCTYVLVYLAMPVATNWLL